VSQFLGHWGMPSTSAKESEFLEKNEINLASPDTRARLSALLNRPPLKTDTFLASSLEVKPIPTPSKHSDFDFAHKKYDAEYFMACEAFKSKALNENKKARFMLRALGRLGCKVNPWRFVNCVPCEDKISGAFHAAEGGTYEVIMCQNLIASQEQFDSVLTHELIHAYDVCRADVDFKNCRHHACTEVRAATL